MTTKTEQNPLPNPIDDPSGNPSPNPSANGHPKGSANLGPNQGETQAQTEPQADSDEVTFLVVTELPYDAPHFDCCSRGRVTVLPGYELPTSFGHNAVIIEHTHGRDCDIVRVIP